MIYEKDYDESILGEAIVYNEIYKQESRKHAQHYYIQLY